MIVASSSRSIFEKHCRRGPTKNICRHICTFLRGFAERPMKTYGSSVLQDCLDEINKNPFSLESGQKWQESFFSLLEGADNLNRR